MQGMFIGRDDRSHRGTFSLLGLDLYGGSGPSHKLLHSLHFPFHGRLADDKDPLYGPFWTGRVSIDALKGTPYTSQMSVDYTDTVFHDAFAGSVPEFTGARVTMHVDWMAGLQGNFPGFEPTPTYVMHNPAAGFTGEYTLSAQSEVGQT